MRRPIDAKSLLNYLATAAEVLADEAEDPTRFSALSEKLAELADEYPEELELALETAVSSGLVAPERLVR
jgi:hypothetical protein